MDNSLISIEHLSKQFGSLKAVDDVSLDVKPNEIYALIGPNGAGKTTLVKVLVGLMAPTKGRVVVCGHDLRSNPLEAKRAFGYLPDNPAAFDYLTGLEFLHFVGALNQISPSEISERIRDLSGIFPIKSILSSPMGGYSRGNRQKLAFLAAMLKKPRVLIIDEPVVGLDPSGITILGNRLSEFAKSGGGVLLVTHTLSFAQKFATRVGIMNRGSLEKEALVSRVDLDQLYREKIEIS